MFDFHEKRRLRKVFYSIPVICVLLFITAVLGMSVYERFKVEREMSFRLENKKTELADLEKKAQAIESQVTHLQNERGIEEELRTRFNVAKKGEEIVVLLEDKTLNTKEATGTPGQQERKASFFQKIFGNN